MKLGALIASALLPVAACAQAAPPPTAAEVQALIRGSRTDLTFPKMEIGAPFKASAQQASYWECDLGQTVWPIHAHYVAKNGMYVRDTDSHWVAFHSHIKNGAWDLSSASRPGDTLNELRP